MRFASPISSPSSTRTSTFRRRQAAELEAHVEEFLRNKQPGQVDSPEVQTIKGMIRRGEARAAGAKLRRARRAAALHGHAVLRNGPREEEAAGRRRHRDGRRPAAEDSAAPDLRGRRSVRSARHAPRVPERRAHGLPALREGRLVSPTAKCGCIAARGTSGGRTKSKWPCR